MISIELSNASNGIIKKIVDTNYNGGGERFEETFVYEIEKGDLESISDFLLEISEDLGLDLGSDFHPNQLAFVVDWGDKYNPSTPEIDEKIKELQEEIRFLRTLKKAKEDN